MFFDTDTLQRMLELIDEKAILAIYDDLERIIDYPGKLADDKEHAAQLASYIQEYCIDTYGVDDMGELRKGFWASERDE